MPILRTLNQNFFKKWSPEMAYVLGFFTADGNMIKNNRGAHFMGFYSTDLSVLHKIRKLLNSDHKISAKNRKNPNSKWKDCYQLQIGSKEIFKDLSVLGMTPNKSMKIRMPDVPVLLLSHFLRGYFDGDGHVSVSTYIPKGRNARTTIITGFTSGSRKFLEDLKSILEERKITVGGSLYETQGHRLCFSTRDSLRLYNFMYQIDGSLYLSRKKSIFKNYFNNVGV